VTGFLIYLAWINLWTFVAFAIDKAEARRAGARLSERTLLLLALVGGGPAAKLAQHSMGHKTDKQPFGGRLNRIVAAQVALVLVVLVLWR